MKIHTVKRGDSLASIAEEYGIAKELLGRINGISEREELCVGEELFITLPTRTYKVARGDTAERIALRFGVRKNTLYALNPHIAKSGVSPGETLILHVAEPAAATAASLGVVYRGTEEEKLKAALPYLTYVSVSEAVADDGRLRHIFDSQRALKIINGSAKIPLMRVTDVGCGKKYRSKASREKFIAELVGAAGKKGYKGITLAVGGSARSSDADFTEFLMELRRKMIGEDLILFTECDENSPDYLSELADGAVFSYDRCGTDTEGDFCKCERAAAIKFAKDSESSKSFFDLPPFAYCGGEYITWEEAMALARRYRAEINTDEKTLLSSYDYKGKRVIFPSLKNIKARLELSSELGFMGISFDIMRVPQRQLYMLGAHARCVNYTGFSSREGCSRD